MGVAGLTPDSFMNMQLNAGAFFEGFEFEPNITSAALMELIVTALSTKDKCLGATSGGGTFSAVPEVRQIEADGMRSPIIGSTVIDSWEVSLSTTLKEITKRNMSRALATAEVDPTTGGIKFRNNLKPSDYIKNLVWIGDLLDGRLVLIQIDNALNITGANFTFTDKGEGTLPVEFRAHQSDLLNMQYAPCEIFFFDTEEITEPEPASVKVEDEKTSNIF